MMVGVYADNAESTGAMLGAHKPPVYAALPTY